MSGGEAGVGPIAVKLGVSMLHRYAPTGIRLVRSSATWLVQFCQRLEEHWRAAKRRANPISAIIIVMNKRDKVDGTQVDSAKSEFQRILRSELRDARGQMKGAIAVSPCQLVRITNSSNESGSVDSIITHLAKELAQ